MTPIVLSRTHIKKKGGGEERRVGGGETGQKGEEEAVN